MGEIFASSRLVLAWLGPESEYNGVALDFVGNLRFYQQILEEIREWSVGPPPSTNSIHRIFDTGRTALCHLLGRSY